MTKQILKSTLYQMRGTELEQTTLLPGKDKKVPKLRKNWSLRKIMPIKAKYGPKNKTYSTRLRSHQCRRRQLDTKQNTLNKQHGPFNKTIIQRWTTILHGDGIG